MLLTACNLQDKALMGRVLADLKEVVPSCGRPVHNNLIGCAPLKKMDECLRRTLANGRRTDDLITEFNLSIPL